MKKFIWQLYNDIERLMARDLMNFENLKVFNVVLR